MKANYLDTLRGGAVRRLAIMRNYADAWNADPDKLRREVPRITWRDSRGHGEGTIASDAHGPTFSKESRREWANIPASMLEGLRDVGHVDEITGNEQESFYRPLMNHSGWFADAHQDELYRGHVWQLPARAGARCYVAGYVERDSGYAVLCARSRNVETFDSLRDAIHAADNLAEFMAEEAREYSEKWSEAAACADDIESLKDEAKGARENWREFIEMARELKTPSAVARSQSLADNARADHAEFIAQIIAKRERIAQLDMSGEFA